MESINVTASDELDTKINGILSIIVQDDGDTFAKRAEMYYQKRPELVEMVEDLQKSYRALAEKYDQLRTQQHKKSDVEGDHDEIEFDQVVTEGRNNVNGVALMENEKLWDELRFKVSALVDDNISHTSELIKRNDEKRGMIKDLVRTRMNRSADDDSVSAVSHKVPKKKTQSGLSRLGFGRCMKSNVN